MTDEVNCCFIRKGVISDWESHFDGEMIENSMINMLSIEEISLIFITNPTSVFHFHNLQFLYVCLELKKKLKKRMMIKNNF